MSLSPNQRVHALAAVQDDVVGHDQLLAAGLGRGAIAWRIKEGFLHPIHRGVYAVGRPALTLDGRHRAATMACGPGAVLTHRAAGAAWALRTPRGTEVDVTIPRSAGLRRPGIRIHHTHRPIEATELNGIAVTTPARTLLDLAATVGATELARAVEQAEILRIFDLGDIDRVLAAHPGRRGRRALIAAIDAYRPVPARSDLERMFLDLCRKHAFPPPLVNHLVDGLEVDFHWSQLWLVVEIDSHRYHGTRAAFERDRRRDAHLVSSGWRVLRFTDRALEREGDRIAATLARVIGQV